MSLILISEKRNIPDFIEYSRSEKAYYISIFSDEGRDIDNYIGGLKSAARERAGSIVIAHGWGATLLPHFAQLYPDAAIRGALLIDPIDSEARAFRDTAWQRDRRPFRAMPLSALPFPALVVSYRDSKNMALARARVFARIWDAGFYDAGEGSGSIADVIGKVDTLLPRLSAMADLQREPLDGKNAPAFLRQAS